MISKNLAVKLTDTTETSVEIFLAISGLSGYDDEETILKFWNDPEAEKNDAGNTLSVSEIVKEAFCLCEEPQLFWGGDSYYRANYIFN